jgi:hypothetical protein
VSDQWSWQSLLFRTRLDLVPHPALSDRACGNGISRVWRVGKVNNMRIFAVDDRFTR